MADQQQLDLLLQGVENWNRWRKQHSKIHPDLSYTNLYRAHFNGADLSYTNLSYTSLDHADLSNANLSYADLSNTILRNADLNGCDLSYANLIITNLSYADLSNAILYRAHFNGAYCNKADLSGALVGYTIFGNVDLRAVKGLETMIHTAPSTIGTDTLLRSEGNISETFLRGAGLTDTFITYVRSLAQNPIEYYTCFISYSSKDHDFAERLHADLQNKGVRCWFASENMKIGDKIRPSIDGAIRIHDKLLLVLSEQSVKSAWVEYEVEAAFAKEGQEDRIVLFPIRLDNAVMESHTTWADHIHETRLIGDFTHWKEHDAYQKSLKRLLRDLQPDIPPKPAH